MGQNRPAFDRDADTGRNADIPVRTECEARSHNPETLNSPNSAIHTSWIEDFLEEICSFPNSPHDDQLDAVSTAIQMMEAQRRIVRAF